MILIDRRVILEITCPIDYNGALVGYLLQAQ
jgi:hypothetical protein